MEEMNPVVKNKLTSSDPLTRADIADIIVSIGKPGEKRAEKIAAVKEVCEQRNTGINADGHAIWDTLDDYGEF